MLFWFLLVVHALSSFMILCSKSFRDSPVPNGPAPSACFAASFIEDNRLSSCVFKDTTVVGSVSIDNSEQLIPLGWRLCLR